MIWGIQHLLEGIIVVIIHEVNSNINEVNHMIILLLTSCDVVFSSFVGFNSSVSGGILSISKQKYNIFCCYFEEISTLKSDGSCFIHGSSGKISKTIFYRSYSTEHSSNVYFGNAVCSEYSSIYVDHCSTLLCGPSQELSTDSCFKLNNGYASISFFNATSNYGIDGASAINIDYSNPAPVFKYVSIVSGYDNRFVEIGVSYLQMEKSNFINSTENNDHIIEVIKLFYLFKFRIK